MDKASVPDGKFQTPEYLSKAIIGLVSTGPGEIENFYIDNKLKLKKVIWKKTLVIHPGKGLIVDGKVRRIIRKDQRWGADTMNAQTTTNLIDENIAFEFWSKENPGRPRSEMPLPSIMSAEQK